MGRYTLNSSTLPVASYENFIVRTLENIDLVITRLDCTISADSRFAPSQWETALFCNDVSHWLGASQESALTMFPSFRYFHSRLPYNDPVLYNVAETPHTMTRAFFWTVLSLMMGSFVMRGRDIRCVINGLLLLYQRLFQLPRFMACIS